MKTKLRRTDPLLWWLEHRSHVSGWARWYAQDQSLKQSRQDQQVRRMSRSMSLTLSV